MKGCWQAVAVMMGLALAGLCAEPSIKGIQWKSIIVRESVFHSEIGMLDTEREDYAKNLAGLAVNQIINGKGSLSSVADARKMLSLALHLSPRSKKALVANFQLSKGVLPDKFEVDYSIEGFGKLLLARGQLLNNQGGAENRLLARYFIELATLFDPKNEDAIYLNEIQRLDNGDLDWAALTNSKSESER